MTPFRIHLFLAGLSLEILLVLWILGVVKWDLRTWAPRAFVWLLAHIVVALAFVAGGELDASYRWWVRLNQGNAPEYVPATPGAGLQATLARQRPAVARPPFEDGEALRRWRDDLRGRLVQRFGLAGPGAPPVVEVLESTRTSSGVRRRLVRFTTWDGARIPAYLFEPAGEGRRPGILVISGHGWGIGEVHRPGEYQHAAALRLAEAGYVTVAPELRGFGALGARAGTDHDAVIHNALLAGTFHKAVLARDLERATDFLVSLPSVDPGRIAATGVSFGGEMAVTYAALDERVGTVVVQGYSVNVGPWTGAWQGMDAAPVHFCHLVPGQNTLFLSEDIFILVSPRPLLVVRGTQDVGPRPEWARFTGVVGQAYAGVGAAGNFRGVIVPGGHEYFLEPALAFFRDNLGRAGPAQASR